MISKLFSFLRGMAFSGLFGYFCLFPQGVTQSTREALVFCGTRIVPALFVYLVLSRVVSGWQPIVRLQKNRCGGIFYAVLMGMLCGIPAGAVNCREMYLNKAVSKKRAEYLLCISSCPSVSFFLSFAGGYVLGDVRMGLKLLLFQLVAFLAVGLLFYPFFREKERFTPCLVSSDSVSLTQAIGESAYAMVKICGFVSFFYVISSAVVHTFKMSDVAAVLVKGLFEFSSGINSAASFDTQTARIMCGLFLGFGSFSGIFQTLSAARDVLDTKMFLLSRIIIVAVMTVLCILT